METTSKKSAPKIAVNSAARLDAALIANDRLKKESLSESDQVVLARNLGTLFKKCQDKQPSLSLKHIFIEAFGIVSGDSVYKKRKRLVILPEEKEVSEKLAKRAWQYHKLAITLSQYIEIPENEPKSSAAILSILRLIEGSSYDLSTAHKDRFNQEYQVEIDSKLRRITEKVVESVDLDWMRTWSEMHTVPIIGTNGDVSRISFSKGRWSERSRYDVSNLNLDGEISCCLAPCVRLGKIISRLPIRRYIDVQIDSPNNEKEVADLIRDALLKLLQSETNTDDMVGDEEYIGYELEKFGMWRNFVEQDDLHFGNSYRVYRNLDLELRYEEKSNKWYPCILSRYPSNGSTYSSIPELLPYLEIISACADVNGIFVANKIEPDKYRVFKIDGAYYIDSYSERWPGDESKFKTSWSAGPFRQIDDVDGVHALDGRYLSALLQSDSEDLESCYFVPLIDNWRDKNERENAYFVKAPNGSLAYYVLKNLAYAPEDERIDQVLIKDAKKKYAMLKEYSLTVAKEYEEAISKF
jgi:hypothetical protein